MCPLGDLGVLWVLLICIVVVESIPLLIELVLFERELILLLKIKHH